LSESVPFLNDGKFDQMDGNKPEAATVKSHLSSDVPLFRLTTN
jgi:hypothetical protein